MNYQSSLFQEVSAETIRDIFNSALLEKEIWETRLLDGGLFNTTYMVEYGPAHKKAVLRLGPINRHLLMGFEENLIAAEIYVYSICRKIGVPCSNVLACDTSRQVLDRDFMIVEYIPSVAMVNAELTEEQRNHLNFQIGKQLAKLHRVTGESFGFVSRIRAGKCFERWSDAIIFEMEDISERLERSGGIGAADVKAVREEFYQSRDLLDEIKEPHLLHTDLWAGNVLLDKDTMEIAAIIDSDRAVFGDIDFEFACSWMNNAAIKAGYEIDAQEFLRPNRVKRRQLYQMFFCLLEAYVWRDEYNNLEQYAVKKDKLMALAADFKLNDR
jgi:fructosamine-3-kinase